jgi:hypothetical protein
MSTALAPRPRASSVAYPLSLTQAQSTEPADSCSCNTTYNLATEQGATLSSRIKITLDAQPVDVTGSTFQFTAKPSIDVADSDPSTVKIDWQETNTPTSGMTWLVVPALVTASMQLIAYVYQIRMVSSGGIVTPIANGSLTIVQPVSSRS